MPRHSCALTLAGIIDESEARVIGAELDRYCDGIRLHDSAFGALVAGEREFFFSAGYPESAATRNLTRPLADVLDRFDVSYCFLVIIDGDEGTAQCQVIDKEMRLGASFDTEHGIFDLSAYPEGHQLRALADRWQEIDACPELHVIQSGHDAMGLAFDPRIERKTLNAYFARQVVAQTENA